MSSHREAPEIVKDPVADSTDLHAFISPDSPDTVTLIANYIPLEGPAGGPNFYEFGDDVHYENHIDNDDGDSDVAYQFNFTSENTIPATLLYNVGPIESLDSVSWNRRQTYSVTRVARGRGGVLEVNLACPPCNIGPLSTPDYPALASAAVHSPGNGRQIFAGQRAEAFFVNLRAIFDLGDLRPIANLHNTFGLPALQAAQGVNSTARVNVHSIAIQVPISDLTRRGVTPTNSSLATSSIGVWTSASRRQARVRDRDGGRGVDTPVPTCRCRVWAAPSSTRCWCRSPTRTAGTRRRPRVTQCSPRLSRNPELAGLLNVLYPGAFPHLTAYAKPRADLEAILLTGIPAGVVSPTFSTFTGTTQADVVRLNLAIPASSSPNALGVLGGDLAGYPNGRRITDDAVTIELQAVPGATIPLVDPTFTPDDAIADVSDRVTGAGLTFLSTFPYLGTPYSGYNVPAA